MPTTKHRLTDNEIALIVPQRVRWPQTGTIAMTRLQAAVKALHNLVRGVDVNCLAAEGDNLLSIDGIRRKRAEIGRQALSELASLKAFTVAEKAVLADIELFEKKMIDIPQPPSDVADAPGQEIRAYIAKQKFPAAFVMQRLSNPRILAAVLSAEAFLSGLNDSEQKTVREHARIARHPELLQKQAELTKALSELREGLMSAQRVILARCELRADGDGQFRSIHEPPSRGKLTAPKTEKTVTAASAP